MAAKNTVHPYIAIGKQKSVSMHISDKGAVITICRHSIESGEHEWCSLHSVRKNLRFIEL